MLKSIQYMPHYGWKTINIHGSTLDAAFRKTIMGLTKIEHLHRVRKSSSLKWKNPELSDIVDMNAEHIVNCEIVGDWDISNDRCLGLRKKCPYLELFWFVFPHIRTEYGEIQSIQSSVMCGKLCKMKKIFFF